VDLIEFCVSSWRICDVRGNRISTGEFSKINFPRNEAKQFKLNCLQSYFNLNIQPVLSDSVQPSIHPLVPRISFKTTIRQEVLGMPDYDCALPHTFKFTGWELWEISVNGYII
jgi:hypothetical protein